jgi:hypothetical protein
MIKPNRNKTMILKRLLRIFDQLEDKTRGKLSHTPFLYAFLGGIGVVLFWRGVWHLADEINISSALSLIAGSIILLITGVFVSAFIGNRLIISGLKGEKTLVEKTEEEIISEENQIEKLQKTLNRVEEKIENIESEINKK